MKRNLLLLIVFVAFFLSDISLHAQNRENIWFDGLSRSYFARDAADKSTTDDTISARNTSNGYNLLDLNTHVNPIKDIEIFAQLRIRNSFGGFFGSGTEINVRQLRAKGVINQKNTLLGFGLDYKIGQNAMVFYRYNQYRYFDPNFIENHLKGWEMILELKINF